MVLRQKRLKPGLIPQKPGLAEASTPHRKEEVTRLLREHRRGVLPVKGLREGSSEEGSEPRPCPAVAGRTSLCRSPAPWRSSVAPSTLGMELHSFIWYASPFCFAPWPLLCPLLVLGWVVILFGKPGTPSSLEVLLLCTATCPCAHRVRAGTLSWHRPCSLPSLEQGKELECRPRFPVPSMRPDNRSYSVIVKLMEHSPLA